VRLAVAIDAAGLDAEDVVRGRLDRDAIEGRFAAARHHAHQGAARTA